MAAMIKHQELSVYVEHFAICLEDRDTSWMSHPFPDGYDPEVFLKPFPGRLDIRSAGHTHTAHFTVEVWDGPPSEPEGEWDERGTASLHCVSGQLRLHGTSGGPATDDVHLPQAPATWEVRLLCTGRTEVAAETLHRAAHNVERYTAQFWPAA
ncbi:hypothetical protein ACGFRG_05405 [Streptomyces sp. NPDC048696]|uniref:hypothetical protein n=1 Tax=Streptomyces sp. NPDC048696 TaxID=3365585 RepID=UPI0037107996